MSILDSKGVVRRVYSTKADPDKQEQNLEVKAGLNRLVWDLRYERPEPQPKAVFSLASLSGVRALTGPHKVRLEMDGQVTEQDLLVKADPRWTQTESDLRAQYDLTMQVKDLFNKCHGTIGKLRSVRSQIQGSADRVKKAGLDEEIGRKSKLLIAKINQLEAKLIQKRNESNQDPINFPSMIDDQIAYLYSTVNSLDDRPNDGAYERFEDLKQQLQEYLAEVKTLWGKDVKDYNDYLQNQGVGHVLIDGR